jgi:hypothetical protein
MGFVRKLLRKAKKKKAKKIPTDGVNKDNGSVTQTSSSHSSVTQYEATKKNKKLSKLGSLRSTEITLEQLPELISDLEADASRGVKTSKALKMLFSLSEQPESYNRIEMVRYENGRIVTALFDVLFRSQQKSNEKYMALLVLNNISIPAENKEVRKLFICWLMWNNHYNDSTGFPFSIFR